MKVKFLKDVESRNNECGASFHKGVAYEVSIYKDCSDREPIWICLSPLNRMRGSSIPSQNIYPRIFRKLLCDGYCKIIKDKN